MCRYTVRSGKRIALTFEEARVGAVRISDGLEALIAPAMLPRGALQHAVLLAIKQVRLLLRDATIRRIGLVPVSLAWGLWHMLGVYAHILQHLG